MKQSKTDKTEEKTFHICVDSSRWGPQSACLTSGGLESRKCEKPWYRWQENTEMAFSHILIPLTDTVTRQYKGTSKAELVLHDMGLGLETNM